MRGPAPEMLVGCAHADGHNQDEDTMVERSHISGWWPAAFDPLKKVGETVAGWLAPRSDASGSSDKYLINMELPGVTAKDIEISMREGTMTVKGEKRFENEESDDNYFFSEREYGTFQRTFRLPADAAADNIVADFRNGLLTISIPKAAAPTVETSKIKIRTS
jgi:HSP20 family protein